MSAYNKSNSSCFKKICDLNTSSSNVKVIGVIVTKEMKSFMTKDEVGTSAEEKRAVLTILLRDSPKHTIMVKLWGTHSSIQRKNQRLANGDVVVVMNPIVKSKSSGGCSEEFNPSSTSDYYLYLNDKINSVEPYNGSDVDTYASLKNSLIVSATNHVKIGQVLRLAANQQPQENQEVILFATFFAVVHEVGKVRDILPKKTTSHVQSMLHKCEIKVYDETCANFLLVTWNWDLISTATKWWLPDQTVLSIVDCRISFDNFRKAFVGYLDSKGVVIANPPCADVERLYRMAQTEALLHKNSKSMIGSYQGTPFDGSSWMNFADDRLEVPLSSIHSIVNVEGMRNRQVDSGYGIVFGMLTKLPIDSDDISQFVMYSCKNCHRRVDAVELACTTHDCPLLGHKINKGPGMSDCLEMHFNANVFITDHTGTFTRCSMRGLAMEQFLGSSVNDFIKKPQHERSQLRFDLMMKRYKIYFQAVLPTCYSPNPFFRILACHLPDVYEIITTMRN